MLGSQILDIFIGLSFIYFFLSLLCMWILELLSSLFQFRSKNLVSLIGNILDPTTEGPNKKRTVQYKGVQDAVWKNLANEGEKMEANIVKTFFEHPVIKSLSNRKKPPTYIPEKDFSLALTSILKKACTVDNKDE